jgi:extradiol dioxygenase family protein
MKDASERTGLFYSVHFAGLLNVQNMLSADTGISWQTEGHSFGDHLSRESVSVTTKSLIEASIVLCSVFVTRVSQCQSVCSLNTRYKFAYSRYHVPSKIQILGFWTLYSVLSLSKVSSCLFQNTSFRRLDSVSLFR